MSTETQSPKVQQGPNLRAAIAQLPQTSEGSAYVLTRDKLEGESPGGVAAAIQGRLVNELVDRVRVIEAASAAHGDGYSESLQCGIMGACDDLRAEMHQIGDLLWAIWADEKGMDVPERRS